MPSTTSRTPSWLAALQDLLERRDHRLAAVQAEALGAGELDVQEALELLGLDQPLQDGALALGGELGLVADALDALLDPGLLVRMLDVHELDADRAAVGLAQHLHDLAQGRRLQPEHVVEEDRPVHVGFGEAVGLRIELRVVLPALQAERIEIGHQVAAHAVDADQHQRADRIDDRRARHRRATADAAGAAAGLVAGGRGGDGDRRRRPSGDRARRPAGAARLAQDDAWRPRPAPQRRKPSSGRPSWGPRR